MKLFSWLESIRRSFAQKRRRAGSSPIGRVEKLEDRTLLSSTPIAHLVKDINISGNVDAREFTESNGVVFFVANDGIHGNELWKTDGSESGTVLVKDINPGYEGSSPTHLTDVQKDKAEINYSLRRL